MFSRESRRTSSLLETIQKTQENVSVVYVDSVGPSPFKILMYICIYRRSQVNFTLFSSYTIIREKPLEKPEEKPNMVHFTFVRKQLWICVKVTIVVFSFFTFGRYILGSKEGAERKQERDGKTDKLRHSGSLNVHCWHSICGSNIDSLTRHVLFPAHPHQRTSIASLRMRTKLQNFGQRIFGYIHPPLNGIFQFSISSDDLAEVWLSSDETPENTKLICQVGGVYRGNLTMGFTKPGEVDKYESQPNSRNINLNGGKRCQQ